MIVKYLTTSCNNKAGLFPINSIFLLVFYFFGFSHYRHHLTLLNDIILDYIMEFFLLLFFFGFTLSPP